MVLQKFQMCDASHQKEFQYCCIKDNRVFCSKCWFKQQHYRQCQSTRCGNYQKLAHLVINRVLELKNIYYLQNMSTNGETFQTARIKSLQLNYQITQIMRQWIEQKLPLFLWSMINQMLHSRYSQHLGMTCNKYDSMCTEMLKTIKNPEEHKKAEYLQTIISNFQTINHEVDGSINSLKVQEKSLWNGKKDQKIEEILEYCRRHLGLLLINVKAQMKDVIEGEISKLLVGFDQSIKFRGVSFPKSSGNEAIGLFKKKQQYRNLSLNTQFFSKFQQKSQQIDIYNGFNLCIPQLQNNPQQLLQLSKSFIKQRLFTLYSQIQIFKSSYPYKCAYVISTCLEPDEDYESTVLELEKSYIRSIETKSQFPFINSLQIVIMGPETIVIRFRNRPEFCYTMKIYNYKKTRENYYKKVRDLLDLVKFKEKPQPNEEKFIEFTQNPSLLQLAYANFQIAVDEIFSGDSLEDKIFEGEKVVAARGMQLLARVIEKWKSQARIDIDFKIAKEEVLQLMV